MTETLKLKPRQLSVEFAADTANKETRTIDLTWYTGAEVERYSWVEGEYRLTLSMEPGHVKMGRLNTGAPILNNHSQDLGAVLGVVDKAWLDNGKGMATIRFSNRAEVDPIWQDIQDGILRNASVGLKIHKLKDVTKEGAKVKSYLATSWEPREISIVPIGADPDAGFSDLTGAGEYFAEIELAERATGPKENVMEPNTTSTGPGAAAAQPVINEAALKQETMLAERKRGTDIRAICATGKLDAKLADEHIEKGTSVEAFRAIAFEALAARSEQAPPTNGHRQAEVTRDERQTFRDGMAEALLSRGNIIKMAADSVGREFIGVAQMGLMGMAAESVRRMGENPNRLSPSRIAELALAAPAICLTFCRVRPKSRFRPGMRKQLASGS